LIVLTLPLAKYVLLLSLLFQEIVVGVMYLTKSLKSGQCSAGMKSRSLKTVFARLEVGGVCQLLYVLISYMT